MGAAAGALAAVESVTGHRPETCPWRAYSDPEVVQVLRAHGLYEDHQFFQASPDPPAWLAEAVYFYRAMLDRVRSAVRRKMKEDAERERGARPGPGWVEEGGGRG